MNNKILLIIFLVSFSLSSCIKGFKKPAYYIKAKFNGEEKIFSKLISGQKGLDNNSVVKITLGAVSTVSNSFPAYDIEIWNLKGNMTTGEYSESAYKIQSRYAISGTSRYSNFANSIEDYKVVVSMLSKDEIKGTFKGTITNSATNENIDITEGEFFMPLID